MRHSGVALAALLCAAILVVAGAAPAETVILQNGQSGYSGCATKTIPGVGSKEKPDAAVLALRGPSNLLTVKFDLPDSLKSKKLVRARLELFVPSAEKLRMICEILAREATAEVGEGAPAMDTTTDYNVGRPKGAVDSYSLWEFQGQFFPHKYAYLGVPKEGKWIDWNVTPLARKWLASAADNHGVILETLALPDKRMVNTTSINFPSAISPDAGHRPRLVLEFEPIAQPYQIGATHTLERICDRDTRFRYFGPFEDKYEMAMARNEFEPFQLLVYPMAEPLKQVGFEWTDLTGPDGAKIPMADVNYQVQEIFWLHANMKVKDWYFHGKNFELPDPLSTARPIDCPQHMTTAFWFTVRTRPDTKPGLYKGTITVKPANAPARKLELTVKVWNYKIPEVWDFQTMGQTCWQEIWNAYKGIDKEKRAKIKQAYIDFLLDHRFNPTEQYSGNLSPSLEDLPYCLSRGSNTIYLHGAFKLPAPGEARQRALADLRKRCDAVIALDKKLRDEGKYNRPEKLIDMSLVYIGDETNKWDQMRASSDAIREVCPELMIMIGGSFPRKELDGVIDIFDPQIDLKSNSTYSLPADQMSPLIAKSQGLGERFFWYVAAGPMLPCPNVQIEDPLIASRVLFWMTYKFGVTGFEYYCYNLGWSYQPKYGDAPEKAWPARQFSPRAFKGEYNGDGMLFYPGPEGPFSSVRFENIRDGIEDWESHFVLRDCAEALQAKLKKDPSLSAKAGPLLARAKELLAVPAEVSDFNFAKWTWEPAVLIKARQELGDTLDAFGKLVSEEEILAVRNARKVAQLDQQRKMLADRAAAAKAAAATRPAAPVAAKKAA